MIRPQFLLYAAAGVYLAFSAPPGLSKQPAQTLGTQTPSAVNAQQAANSQAGALTWDQLKARFEANNPALKADALGVEESRAQEITAHLRPNPQFAFSTDGTQLTPNHGVWSPLSGMQYQ